MGRGFGNAISRRPTEASGPGCISFHRQDRLCKRQDKNNDDDALRTNAIDAPYLEKLPFDPGEPQSEDHSKKRATHYDPGKPAGERTQERITHDADHRDRHAVELGKWALVYDAAVPYGVDPAR